MDALPKGKGGGRPKSAADLDAEMEAYMTNKSGGGEEGGGGRKGKGGGKPPADKGSLDDDLDSYMKKPKPAEE